MGEKLLSALGADLSIYSWNKVKEVKNDLTPREWDLNDAAARLAANLVKRMTDKLSEDPEVTARALWLYDRDLCPQLIHALRRYVESEEQAERELEEEAAYERLAARN
jgi:hypothetical protein